MVVSTLQVLDRELYRQRSVALTSISCVRQSIYSIKTQSYQQVNCKCAMHWGQSRHLLLQTVCDLSSKGRAACCIQMGSLEKVSEQHVNHTSLTQVPPNNEVRKIKDNFSLKTWRRGSQEEETGWIPRGFKLTKYNKKEAPVSYTMKREHILPSLE